MRDSFILYSNYHDILKDSSNEELGCIFRAILSYVKNGELINLPSNLTLAFGFIKNQLDVDEEKYQEIVEKRKQSGRKGGLSKNYPKEANDKNEEEQELIETNEANLANANFAKHNDNVNVNDNDNDNDNVNVNVNVNDNLLSLNVENRISENDREILRNYIIRNKLAKKNVNAYLNAIIRNGDHIEILRLEKNRDNFLKERKSMNFNNSTISDWYDDKTAKESEEEQDPEEERKREEEREREREREEKIKKLCSESSVKNILENIRDRHSCAQKVSVFIEQGITPPDEIREVMKKYGIQTKKDLDSFYLGYIKEKLKAFKTCP